MTILQITTSVILLIQHNLRPRYPPGGEGVPMTTKQGSYSYKLLKAAQARSRASGFLPKQNRRILSPLPCVKNAEPATAATPVAANRFRAVLCAVSPSTREQSASMDRGVHISECPLVRRNLAETRDHCYETPAEGDVLEEQGNH